MNEIPETTMVAYYNDLRQMNEEQRLAEARRWLDAPDRLATKFSDSVEEFTSSFKPPANEPFHPKDTEKRQRDKQKFAQQSKTRVFAAALTMMGEEVIEVPGDPDLSFRYVDREIVPARAPEYRWPSTSKPPQVDLLLAHVDGTPIVAEAKIGRDMDPFFALIQVLAMVSQLATPAQLDRLRHPNNYPEAFDPKATKVDAYVVTAGSATGTWTNFKAFSESASELAGALMQCKSITDSIRRIAAVSIQLRPSPLYAF